MKRKTIITSVLVIVLCLGLISGSTFALFTSESSVNIAVTSGKVDVKASLKTPLELYSANASVTTTDGKAIKTTDTSSESADGILTGTFAGTYYYQSQPQTFLNGGTASYTAPTLTIDRMTPGDKVATELEITNKSNVAIKYRLKIAATAENDANAKILEVLKVKFEGILYTGLKNYTSSWITKQGVENSETYKSKIEVIFPLDVDGEDYMDKTVQLTFTVEAVQSNANTSDTGSIEYVSPTSTPVAIATTTSVVTAVPNTENGTTATLVAAAAPTVEEDKTTEVTLTNVGATSDTVKLTVETHDVSAAAATQYTIVSGNNVAAGSIDLTLTVNDTVVSQFANNASAKIVTYVAKGLSDVKVVYNGDNTKAFGVGQTVNPKNSKDAVTAVGDYFYNSTTGELVFITDHFSEYVVTTSAKVLVVETNTGYNTFASGVAALTTDQTLKLLNDCEVGEATLTSPLKVTATGATIDLDGKVLTVNNNFSFVIEAKDAVVKNGKIYSAENTAKATKLNSYVLVVNNCDGVVIDGITTKGGISVGGSNGETPNAGAATNVTIKNCDVLSGDYYAVCSQMNSTVTIKNGTYNANSGSIYSGVIQGTFVGTDGPKGTIVVEDGTFVGAIASNDAGDIIIKGGKFSVEPAAKYIVSSSTVSLVEDWYVVSEVYADGDGTQTNPYLITKGKHFESLYVDIAANKTAGKYYKLGADIEIINATTEAPESYKVTQGRWDLTPSTGFKGNFDGNNHTINFSYSGASTTTVSLFGNMTNAQLSNLKVVCDINNTSTTQWVASIGIETENCTFNNVDISGTIKNRNDIAGFCISSTNATYVDCDVTATLHNIDGRSGHASYVHVGGFEAQCCNGTTFTNCSYNGTIKIEKDQFECSGPFASGFLASQYGTGAVITLTNCVSNVTIVSDYENVYTNTEGSHYVYYQNGCPELLKFCGYHRYGTVVVDGQSFTANDHKVPAQNP